MVIEHCRFKLFIFWAKSQFHFWHVSFASILIKYWHVFNTELQNEAITKYTLEKQEWKRILQILERLCCKKVASHTLCLFIIPDCKESMWHTMVSCYLKWLFWKDETDVRRVWAERNQISKTDFYYFVIRVVCSRNVCCTVSQLQCVDHIFASTPLRLWSHPTDPDRISIDWAGVCDFVWERVWKWMSTLNNAIHFT